MTKNSRFAVYYAPPRHSDLAGFGATWLGWDATAGAETAHPTVPGLDVAAITATPRKYGFHGTLKPPFRLAEGLTVQELERAVRDVAQVVPAFEAPALAVRRLGCFLALVPSRPCPELAGLAARCVRDLDRFRAPAPKAELDRRRQAGLSPTQEKNLTSWGYPYVLDEFRFHLTLSGRLETDMADRVLAALTPLTSAFCEAPLPIEEICLFAERPDARFEEIDRYRLRRA